MPCGQDTQQLGASGQGQHCASFPRVARGRQQPWRGSGALGRVALPDFPWCPPAVLQPGETSRLKERPFLLHCLGLGWFLLFHAWSGGGLDLGSWMHPQLGAPARSGGLHCPDEPDWLLCAPRSGGSRSAGVRWSLWHPQVTRLLPRRPEANAWSLPGGKGEVTTWTQHWKALQGRKRGRPTLCCPVFSRGRASHPPPASVGSGGPYAAWGAVWLGHRRACPPLALSPGVFGGPLPVTSLSAMGEGGVGWLGQPPGTPG